MFDKSLIFSIEITVLLTACLLFFLIYIQKKNHLFQFIRPEGPESHHSKKQTVTSGGVAIIVAQVAFLCYNSDHLFVRTYCTSLVLFGILGLIDDVLKISQKGMSSKIKFIGQCFISLYLLSNFIYSHYPLNLVFTHTVIPFWGKIILPPIFLVLLNFLTHISASNALNLTDGQDGLLTQILLGLWSVITIFTLLSLSQKAPVVGSYPLEPFVYIGIANLVTLSVFLWFNHYPAQIFMGDSGSLGLGGSLATVAMMMLYPFGLLFIAIVPLLETISVIVQVASFKTRGKRIFKMAPIHHHFELSGHHETTVSYKFTLFNTLITIFAVGSYISIITS